ncbi:MAG: cupin domain-containing protein [Planctomycetota bacterium]
MSTAETLHLDAGAHVPNHPTVPVLLYRGGAAEAEDELRKRLRAHGWPADWTGTVYDYQHYHSTAHEFLAVRSGTAAIQLGGPEGPVVDLVAGDAVLLPAGTGHCRRRQSDGFQVLAAYPQGQDWDLIRAEAPPDPAVLERIRAVPIPDQDPLGGTAGAVVQHWHATGQG